MTTVYTPFDRVLEAGMSVISNEMVICSFVHSFLSICYKN